MCSYDLRISGGYARNMRTLIAYAVLVMLIPTTTVAGSLLFPITRSKFLGAAAGALFAVFCTVKVFGWLNATVTFATFLVMLALFVLNDLNRVSRAEGDLRKLRLQDLFGDCIGIVSGFIILWSQ